MTETSSTSATAGRAAVPLILSCLVLTLVAAFLRAAKSDPEAPPLDPRIPVAAADEEFATSQACRRCHPGEYESWHASYHRTMTQLASPEAIRAPFDRELKDNVLTCRLERKGDEFWATVFPTDWRERYLAAGIDPDRALTDPQLSPFSTKRVLMTTGSHHMQIYWLENAGSLVELPFYYHIDGERWIPRDDSVLAPPQDRGGQISSSEWRTLCIECHAVGGNPGLDPRTGRLESTVAEFGISCEACHGPAQQHIRHHSNPVNRYRQHLAGEPDSTIVNPARMSHRESAEVCGQCHTSFDPQDRQNFLQNGLGYRAGGDLEKTHRHHRFDFQDNSLAGFQGEAGLRTYWKDGTCCVGGDEYLGLIESPCFQRGEMSCLSCHSMHDSAPNDQLARKMDGDQACLQCHSEMGQDIAAHTHHATDSAGSRCYNCHMPHTTYALFTAMRSHRVGSPDISVSAKTGKPNACNLCHLDQTLDWSARYLTEWYGAEAVDLSEEQKTTAASLLWLLKGDAAQRVITAWHMGWQPAQQASGTGWKATFLAQLLEDPYSVVRSISHTALTRLPHFADFEYDYIGPPADRAAAKQRAMQKWEALTDRAPTESARARVLLDEKGNLRRDDVRKLIQQRDDTPVVIAE